MRDLDIDKVLPLTVEMLRLAVEFDTIPGSTNSESGNYLEHDLEGAIREMKKYLSNITQ
jgi:S-ribosylhomocysteine lyase LuxS involved in autoinducer biosynthesis